MKQMDIRRGDVVWVDFDPSLGTEIKKRRPALVCSQDDMNANCNRVIVAPLSTNVSRVYSFEYLFESEEVRGKIMLDQIRSIDKCRIGKKIRSIPFSHMCEIDLIIKLILGLK